MALGLGFALAPEAIAAAATAACSDGNCTNEVQMGMEAGQKILDAASADGDPTNEARTAASVVDKLQRYLLNPEHPYGESKAAWFEQALGYTRGNYSGAD